MLRRVPLALALAAAVSGCAIHGVNEDWHAQPSFQPLPAHHVTVAESDLPRACGKGQLAAGLRLHGCAIRLIGENVCVVYTAAEPPRWLMEHELKHCAGWEHGD